MSKKVSEILEECREWVFDGKDYLDIKKELESRKIDAETIKLLLLKTDEIIVEYQFFQQHKTNALITLLAGGVIFLIGLLASLTAFAITKGFRYFSLALAVFGAYLFKVGFQRYRLSPNEVSIPESKRKGKFDRYTNN
ncbi:MAG: hypothetical protein GYB31_14375 [Bacteroidetes bacterium]|nr:hypothetical protein [Bacteroidota bacterium]